MKTNYKIALILCYFGKFPNYFDLFLTSCSFNSTVDFLIFTDNHIDDAPQNVNIIHCSFDQIRERIQSNFDFLISCVSPYKLCDYKPAYGMIFKDYLSEYDFWGHIDADVIWGNIRKYITDDILNNSDKVLMDGHFSLYRNNAEMTQAYKTMTCPGAANYMEVFSSPKYYSFDEWGIDEDHADAVKRYGMARILSANNVRIYNKVVYANPINKYFTFRDPLGGRAEERAYQLGKRNTVYSFREGTLEQISIDADGELVAEERMYIHLMHRKMKVQFDRSKTTSQFLIVPNAFVDYQTVSTKRMLKRLSPKRLIDVNPNYCRIVWRKYGFGLIKRVVKRIQMDNEKNVGH